MNRATQAQMGLLAESLGMVRGCIYAIRSNGDQAKALREFNASDHHAMKKIWERVLGNRPANQLPTHADMALVMAAALRFLLSEIEKPAS